LVVRFRPVAAQETYQWFRAGVVKFEFFAGRSTDSRPLPKHHLQGGGYILRPGWAGCFTLGNPVPPHAEHLISVSLSMSLDSLIRFTPQNSN
jgi:hypothetical protein